MDFGPVLGPLAAPFFYSAFFPSVWLWLYILAWMLSRVLVRMSDGVGFLLRVTDVERQPFRSVVFATVIVTDRAILARAAVRVAVGGTIAPQGGLTSRPPELRVERDQKAGWPMDCRGHPGSARALDSGAR